MPERPGSCYRRLSRPYTQKKYIRKQPQSKIRKFDHGNPDLEYDYELRLVATAPFQVLSRSLESARISTLAQLRKGIEEQEAGFFFRVVPYPHHIVRRHAMAAVHKAERLQKGMRLAFGKPFATAARVRAGQEILVLRVKAEDLYAAKNAIRIGKLKLPHMTSIQVEKVEKSAK